MPSPPIRRRRDRRRWRSWRLLVLTAAVALGHLWLADEVVLPRLGDGAADSMPRRIEVAFVRELAPSAPPVVAAAAARPAARPRVAAPAAAQAASAPAEMVAEAATKAATKAAAREAAEAEAEAEALAKAQPAAETQASAEASLQAPTLAAVPAVVDPPLVEPPLSASAAGTDTAATALAGSTAVSDAAAALTAVASTSAASAAAGFEWPPSTRLSYHFTGNYRGPVSGQASVEWLREGQRYQVFMEVIVGSSFAPLVRRRVSSEGEITPQGLRPRRYDEETKALVGSARHSSIQMDAATVRFGNGAEVPRPAGLQDSASQFVQLTWLFTTQPQWLQSGQAIALPLALPRRIEPWIYDVMDTETLQTPAGPVAAVHVKPRRPGKAGDILTAEIWVAPSLQYLPVRIVIRQDADTFIDMLIERLPEQAVQR